MAVEEHADDRGDEKARKHQQECCSPCELRRVISRENEQNQADPKHLSGHAAEELAEDEAWKTAHPQECAVTDGGGGFLCQPTATRERRVRPAPLADAAARRAFSSGSRR